jgi:hypothetical protein
MTGSVKIEVGGVEVDAEGRALPDRKFRDAWVLSGDVITLDPVKTREIMIGLVKAEAQRRIIAACGARDLMGCLIRQVNGRVDVAVIDRIRERSNKLEAMSPIPDNFADDKWW